MSSQPIIPAGPGKAWPGVSSKVVGLWIALIVAIAGSVILTDTLAVRDRSPKPAASQSATHPAPSQPAPTTAPEAR